MTWGPDDDRPIDYVPADGMVLANDGHVHIVDRRYIAAGLREAAEWCADAAEDMNADWADLYLSNPQIRARMDELSLDDQGHWHCPLDGSHDWDDACDCDENGES